MTMKSDCRMDRARASRILAGAAHPRTPSMRNVMVTETAGDVFNGSMARTVSSRKSHGMERNKSIAVFAARSEKPPKNPGAAPMARASNTETAAAAGASNIETRVPCNNRAKRSRPKSSVPSQCWVEAPAFTWSRSWAE